ncbi:MAG: hypothetical protein ACP5GU_06250 [Thermoprotei archaeon]
MLSILEIITIMIVLLIVFFILLLAVRSTPFIRAGFGVIQLIVGLLIIILIFKFLKFLMILALALIFTGIFLMISLKKK